MPQLHHILTLFGSPQIRNVGTIGGNIADASPIADSIPFLYVVEAELEIEGPSGQRHVNINDFYRGYKQFDLQPGELITRVHIPIPNEDQILRLYKVSRRLDLDIASFTAAIMIELDGDTIDSAAIALGAVGPTVIRAKNAEHYLAGKPLNEETMWQAGETAVAEISPITDVRGRQDFREQLTRNVFLKFYYETIESETTTGVTV